ncbi:MAG: transcription termination/antitermination factor NusG [Lachnospiraceae bacterium]|uniref:Transcription termination/antitermination protein NusG n=1 Tax=Candidatus Weimeria bifida TaxID=2599074 RepID=A0A6N7J118_9FIRM|nr:transcription termination/antitermination factor NusG [Candidatus Weimeria bifida]RRF97370.1 MAG: transcription termination/antitermination factor NusG [Lachnospiraceae bacterium]
MAETETQNPAQDQDVEQVAANQPTDPDVEKVTADLEEDSQSQVHDSEEDSDESPAKWYVAHTYSGYENKVKTTIEETVANRHLEDQILEVMVPTEEVSELKNGRKRQVQKKLFPGYVMIRMIMNDDTWYIVRNTRGVTGFVGPGSKPVPLTEYDMRNLGIKTKVRTDVDFAEGDTVSVIGGIWKDTTGVITALNPSKQTVTISVEMFGRETPVEIGFADVKKI